MSSLKEKSLKDIIIETCDKYDITAYEIEKATGLNASGVQRILNNEVNKPQKKTINKILAYLEKRIVGINLYNNLENKSLVEEPLQSQQQQYVPKITQDRVVPFYNLEISGSTISSFDDAKEHIEFYIDYKPLNDCTAYLPYFGNSMYPMFSPGNTLAVKKLSNFDVILWGEPHLIITSPNANSYKTIKCVYQHSDKDKIILRAPNPSYRGDIVIKKSDILSLYLVKGRIELNEL